MASMEQVSIAVLKKKLKKRQLSGEDFFIKTYLYSVSNCEFGNWRVTIA